MRRAPVGTRTEVAQEGGAFPEKSWATIAETEREQRKFDANLLTAAKQGNKSFIIKGRGSSVVEQPIRNRQVASSTLALGSKLFRQ